MTGAPTKNALDRSLARAVAWNAAAKWSTQVLSWVSTIVVARLLMPSDYGLVGMAGVYLNLAGLVGQFGIADAVIALRNLTRQQIAGLNTVAVTAGLILFALSCVVAHPLARFFSTPPLRAVLIVASTTYLITGIQVVPQALLQKELRFKLLAGIEMVRSVSQIVATLGLAWLGFGYWSLVNSYIVGAAVSAGLTLCWQRHRFAVPRFAQLRRELQFSWNITVSGIAWYSYSNADFLVAGRMLGQAPLGDYTVAWTISAAPIEKIATLLTNITPSFFSAVQHDKAELRRYLLQLTEMLSCVTVPLSIGLALVADYLVPVLLGPKWMGVIGPLRLLGLLMAFRSITILPSRVLTAIGETSFVMWASIATAIIMPLGFYFGSRWGTNGIAATWIVVYPPIMVPIFYKCFQRIEMKSREYVSSLMPALASSVIMAAAVVIVHLTIPQRWSLSLRLSALVALGVLVYAGALFALYREQVGRIVRAVRSMNC